MKKKSPKQVLKEFGWIYIFFFVVAIVFAIITLSIKELPKEAADVVPKDLDISPRNYIASYFAIAGLLELWYFWLIRRFVSGKSKGTFFMVLLIIGVVGSAITLITNPGSSTINLVFDAVVLYFLLKARKEDAE